MHKLGTQPRSCLALRATGSAPAMRRQPNMVMIGAAGRNTGKTELACQLIRRCVPLGTTIGVKITTIDEERGTCPRGGAGCGVCANMGSDFVLSEEVDGPPGKDTMRMREAGAQRVLWLRVRKDKLAAGVDELLRHCPAGAAIVCESNSARRVVEPGLFVVLQEKGNSAIKQSCREVIEHADHVEEVADPAAPALGSAISFAGGRWLLRADAQAIILAGGLSRRMGGDKSLMPLDGAPMIEGIARQLAPLFREVVVSANDAAKYRFLGLRVLPDRVPGQGPLMGIASCIDASPFDVHFVTACDVPKMNIDLIRALLRAAREHDVVMPRWCDGRVEPLFAVYGRSVAAVANRVLAQGQRRIVDLFPHVRAHFVQMPETGWYRNINTPRDFLATADEAGIPPLRPSSRLE